MQTVEKFPLSLSPQQEAVLGEWLETARLIWNEGRSLLIQQRMNTSPNKVEIDGKKKWVLFPSCQVTQAFFCNEIDGQKVFAPHSWILPKGRKGGTVDRVTGQTVSEVIDCDDPMLHPHIRVGQCCPVRGRFYREPRIGFEPIAKFTLQNWFAQKRVKESYSDRPEFVVAVCEMPAWFVRGVCTSLTESWERFTKGTGGQPRFKPYHDGIFSLSYGDAKALKMLVHPEDIATTKKLAGVPYSPRVDGFIQLPKIGWVRVERLAKVWGDRPILVLELVKSDDGWNVHLTGWEEQTVDQVTPWVLAYHQPLLGDMPPKFKMHLALWLRNFSPWEWWRTAHTTLDIQKGHDYVVAKDDRGTEYSVLPRRASDGALDPHGLIPELDKEIEYLQKAIAKQRELGQQQASSYGLVWRPSNRMIANQKRLRKAQKHRAAILKNSRKKIAHFISERSAKITINLPKSDSKRTKQPTKKAIDYDPAKFEAKGRDRISEANRREANASPGDFVLLIKNEAKERMQKVLINKPETSKKKAKK